MFKGLSTELFYTCFKITLLLFIPGICSSQDHQPSDKPLLKNISIGSRFYYGSFLTTKSKAEYIRDSYASFGEVFIQLQTNGSKDWQVSHHYPQWGISFLHGNTGSRQYIGNLNALSAYLNLPLITSPRYAGSFMIGTGPGWISKPYNVYTNPKNTLIGTRLNAYINLALQNEIRISRQFFLEAGLSFMHLSNGGTTLPNLGLNTPCLQAGIRYAFAEPAKEEKIVQDSFSRKIIYKVYTTIGLKQASWIGGNYYVINNLQAEAAIKASRNYSFGAGILFSYNRALDFFPLENPATEKRGVRKLQIGAYASYEHFFGRLSVPLHIGAYVYNKAKYAILFQEFGMRYQISKHLSTELLLKLHSGQADFIHAGVGYIF